MSIFLLICFLAGGLGAILQGMLGIGTGIVIVPLLTFLLPSYGMDATVAIHIALATSMAAIATNSITALLSHARHGNVQWSIFKRIILFSLLGSTLGAILASYLSVFYLREIFGTFLILTAIFLWVKKTTVQTTDPIPEYPLPKVAAGGFGIGAVASLIGSGGGILMVPFLHSLQLKMRYAVGTSTLIGFPVAIVGAFMYAVIGLTDRNVANLPYTMGYLHLPAFLSITIAGMICAPLGVKLSTRVNATLLKKLFAILIIFIGAKMLWSAYS